MRKSKIQTRVRQYKKLEKYRTKSDEELFELAKEALELEEHLKEMLDQLPKDETKLAKKLFEKYLEEHHFESINDINLLSHLIYLEMVYRRVQRQINNFADKDVIPPKHVVETLVSLEKQINEQRNSLGLADDKKQEHADIFKSLKNKLTKHVNEHKGAFYFQCPSCGKMILLMRKVKDYEAFEWKMFKGTFVYNKKLMEMIKEKRMTIEEVSEVFGCSPDYITGIYNKIYLEEINKET